MIFPDLRRWIPLTVVLSLAPFVLWMGVIFGRPQKKTTDTLALRITAINVGQGESTLIQTPGGANILIGAGSTETSSTVVETLQNAGVKRIDLLVLPYPYAEAIGGVPDLFDAFEIQKVLEPGGERINAHITGALRLANEFQTEWQTVRTGVRISFRGDPLRMDILGPPVNLPKVAAPDNSLVIRLQYKNTRFLFTGGIGKAGERVLLASMPDLQSDCLFVARSGSDQASSLEFLRLVRPQIAVISVGPNGDGFPGSGAINRLKATGARILRTDDDGGQNITLWSDGDEVKWRIRQPKGN